MDQVLIGISFPESSVSIGLPTSLKRMSVINEYLDIGIFMHKYIHIQKYLVIFITANVFGYSIGDF
jgi:hypothetical protein